MCSGYRNTEQLRIRDETQATQQKALTSRFVPSTLDIPIRERARNALFNHYVSGFSKTYDVLDLYQQNSDEKQLVASVDAVSLAFFSFQFDCTPASTISREAYLSALPLLNSALRTPKSATSDSTLLAILLLDLYEKITNNNPRSIDSWMSHIKGALALVDLRDEPRLQDDTGRRLSARLSTNLLISCVAAKSPVPPALIKLRSDLEPFSNTDDPKWRLSGLVIEYTNLKAAVQDGRLSDSEIITRAMELDLQFMLFAKDMPSTWLFSTTDLEEASERVFEMHYDTYPDHLIAQGWNVSRLMRILLNNVIRSVHNISQDTESCFQGGSFHRSMSMATDVIDSIAKEICATVPQFTRHEKSTQRSKTYSMTQKLQSYTLLFALYVAGLYASPGTQIKPWVIKQLRFMSHDMGIRNADVVADILVKDERTCPWDVYAVLGSYAFAA